VASDQQHEHPPQGAASIRIRAYSAGDLASLIALFRAAVEQIAVRHYSPAQIRAWVATADDEARFASRRESHWTWVAEVHGRIAGFTELEPSGHVDMLYVHPDFQRRGVARALLRHVESSARALQLPLLYTEASITARPVFEALGFEVTLQQTVTVYGETMVNFRMRKPLVALATSHSAS
jgi:putative acetyltransferase